MNLNWKNMRKFAGNQSILDKKERKHFKSIFLKAKMAESTEVDFESLINNMSFTQVCCWRKGNG